MGDLWDDSVILMCFENAINDYQKFNGDDKNGNKFTSKKKSIYEMHGSAIGEPGPWETVSR